jgi:hypothetical protein
MYMALRYTFVLKRLLRRCAGPVCYEMSVRSYGSQGLGLSWPDMIVGYDREKCSRITLRDIDLE